LLARIGRYFIGECRECEHDRYRYGRTMPVVYREAPRMGLVLGDRQLVKLRSDDNCSDERHEN
jgi:hypothetical protein